MPVHTTSYAAANVQRHCDTADEDAHAAGTKCSQSIHFNSVINTPGALQEIR